MLSAQGELGFQLWFGCAPQPYVMRESLKPTFSAAAKDEN
jgi:hypothetical protein